MSGAGQAMILSNGADSSDKLQEQHKMLTIKADDESGSKTAGRTEAISCRTPGGSVIPEGFRAIGVKVTPWKPDNTKCHVCEDKFTWFNHRHKCRNCYEYVCNSCALSRKVLRAYTPPKRVCDVCINKYWAAQKPAQASATDSADVNTDMIKAAGRPSLTVATENNCPIDGPCTAPMSLSPSTPMTDGAFFASGSDKGDHTKRCRTPMLSPSLLASTPEDNEGEKTRPKKTCLSPAGTWGTAETFFGGDHIELEDIQEAEEEEYLRSVASEEISSVNYDGDDEGSDCAVPKRCDVHGETAIAPLAASVSARAEDQEEDVLDDLEAEEEPRERQLASVVLEENTGDAAAVNDEDVAEEKKEMAAAAGPAPVPQVDASVVLLTLAAAALPSVLHQAVSSAAAASNESSKSGGNGGDGDAVLSFAVGLGWGVVAAGVGFGIAMFFRRL